MAKRTATSDLNHDNWDREDDPEESGTFSKAPEEMLKRRIIKVAKRRNLTSTSPQTDKDDEKPNAFGGFAAFSSKPTPSSNSFSFLKNVSSNTATNHTDQSKSNGSGENIDKDNKIPDEYYAKLKGLNESVSQWISKHVTENPLINLQPVFKDYNNYMEELEKIKMAPEKTETQEKKKQFSFMSANLKPSEKFSFGTSSSNATTTTATFSFGANPIHTTTLEKTSSIASTVTVSSFGSDLGNKPTFSFGNSGSAPANNFSFNTAPKTNSDDQQDEANEDEPPKTEFTPVVEDGSIYSIRCKVFVKKDGAFGDRGVGKLYLKPVPDSEKTQLIVRADTNLGNLICNFIISEGIPMQRMGKKDVMLVCLPTPETKPPPVPVLFRVKTTEDADALLKVLQEHKK